MFLRYEYQTLHILYQIKTQRLLGLPNLQIEVSLMRARISFISILLCIVIERNDYVPSKISVLHRDSLF
jgi:hypothetical protein